MSREPAIKEDGDHLTLSGVLTIEHGHKLREVLLGIIARRSRVLVSLAEVEDVPTTEPDKAVKACVAAVMGLIASDIVSPCGF